MALDRPYFLGNRALKEATAVPARDQRQPVPFEDRAQHRRIARKFVAEFYPLEPRPPGLAEAGFKRYRAAKLWQIVIAPADWADAETCRHGLRLALLGPPSA